jgi:hypothetical protein
MLGVGGCNYDASTVQTITLARLRQQMEDVTQLIASHINYF